MLGSDFWRGLFKAGKKRKLRVEVEGSGHADMTVTQAYRFEQLSDKSPPAPEAQAADPGSARSRREAADADIWRPRRDQAGET